MFIIKQLKLKLRTELLSRDSLSICLLGKLKTLSETDDTHGGYLQTQIQVQFTEWFDSLTYTK